MATYTFITIADLRAATAAQNDTATLLGYYLQDDGGGGEFYWETNNAVKNLPDNDGTIIGTSNMGRWVRIFSGSLSVRWFGAKANDNVSSGNTNSTAFKKAIDAAYAGLPNGVIYNQVFVPAGKYYIGSTIEIKDKPNLKIYGEGKSSVLRCNGITIFSIFSSTYNPDTASQLLVTGNEIKDITLRGKSLPADSPSTNSIGINLLGVTNGVIERVYYSGLDKVINQDQAESYVFRNITPVSLENIYTNPPPPAQPVLTYSDDCNYIIYSTCGPVGDYRSNDNVYTEIVGRGTKSEIYLDVANPGGVLGKGIHDGASISGCIFFQCEEYNIYIKEARESTITNNKLFVSGKDAIYLYDPIYCTVIGNLISTPGNLQIANGITIFYQAGTPLFGSVTVTGNVIERPSGNGIELTACDGITISDNVIISPCAYNRKPFTDQLGKYSGIKISKSKNLNITRNVCQPYYDNQISTPVYYPVNWKADIELDSLCYGSVLHDTTYQSRGVLNSSSNVLSYSGYADYEEVEYVNSAKAPDTNPQVFGFTTSGWMPTNCTLTPETSVDINPKFKSIIGNNYLQGIFADSNTTPALMASGVGANLYAGQYATFSVWARKKADGLTNPVILILQLFTNPTDTNALPAIQVIYLDETWRRYFITAQQPLKDSSGNPIISAIPSVRIVSTKQPLQTAYFCPIQVTYTKQLLPTLFRTFYGFQAPDVDNTNGYWYQGDQIKNALPVVDTNNQIIEGWMCITTGAPGVWKALKRTV